MILVSERDLFEAASHTSGIILFSLVFGTARARELVHVKPGRRIMYALTLEEL